VFTNISIYTIKKNKRLQENEKKLHIDRN